MNRTLTWKNGQWVADPPYTDEELAKNRRRFNRMVEAGEAPTALTDREFLAGRHERQFQKLPQLGDHLRRVAENHGQDTTGKIYMGSLARFPGDPEAWVDGRGDVRRVLERRGWGAEGAVDVKMADFEEPTRNAPLAADLVEEYVEERLEAVPAGEKVDREAVREAVVAQYSPHWAPT